ncbi:MAG TPA: NUDIX domain-containing protein [Flavisolibacter sp.]
MHVTIYFERKPLFIVSSLDPEMEEYLHHEETIFIDEYNSHTVKAMLHEMEQPQILRGVFLHENVEEALRAFKKRFTVIRAAGGLVYNPKKELLFIFRRGRWDLPKGKIDPGETADTCALREISEETGLENASIVSPLHTSYHTYHENGKFLLKETEWFLMKAPAQQDFTPQEDEDIEKCEWVKVDALQSYLDNTHASIVDVIRKGLELLPASRK